jgi:AcrR family transcriptional regulator
MLPAPTSSEPRRPRGRPRSLTAESILDVALTLVEEDGAAEFTLAKLGARLGVPVPSLYTYFPNRDALLDAVSDRVFARFSWVPHYDAPLTDELLSWLRALKSHFDHYPMALQLLGWTRHISPAWMRVLAPVISHLYAEGLRGSELASTCIWFINSAAGVIYSDSYTKRHAPRPLLGGFDWLAATPQDHQAQLEFWSHTQFVDREQCLETSFRLLVDGVLAAVPKHTF